MRRKKVEVPSHLLSINVFFGGVDEHTKNIHEEHTLRTYTRRGKKRESRWKQHEGCLTLSLLYMFLHTT